MQENGSLLTEAHWSEWIIGRVVPEVAKKLAWLRPGHSRLQSLSATIGVALLLANLGGCRPATPDPAPRARLIATVRSEPRSFNRVLTADRLSALLAHLTHGRLVRVNSATQDIEPWLAESWVMEENHRDWRVTLRRDVRFSDGEPFTSADVEFSLAAVFDPAVGSPLAEALAPAGHPIRVVALDPYTVRVSFTASYGPGMRLLEALPILPRHRLQKALSEGTFKQAWSTTTPPSELVGLGPFRISRYIPGQRLELERNPHYWRRGADGTRLPLLDELILEIVPDQNAEMLRLETGQADLVSGELRPEDWARIERLQEQGRLKVIELGIGLDPEALWFNLTPHFARREPSRAAWMQRLEFRKAVSLAIDRVDLVRTIYLGAGVPIGGPVTPGNRLWHDDAVRPVPQDTERSRALLTSIGLVDRDGDGIRQDSDGHPIRLTLLTQRGHAIRERTAAYLEQDLVKVGIDLDVVALDTPALVARLSSGDFESVLFVVQSSDTDPAANLDFWRSSGAFHLWFPSQATPSTDWETRLDALMDEQVASTDPATRRAVFRRAQLLLAEHEPIIHFAAPVLRVAVSPRVQGLQPGLLQPYLLWNADSLAVSAP